MWLDNLIGYFSPSAGFDRVRKRKAMEVVGTQKRKYEGASTTRRNAGWLAPGTGANAAKSGAIDRLRNRSRDLVRNNAYAKRAGEIITSNIVGKGIKANIKADDGELSTTVQGLWDQWSSDPTAFDYEGVMDFQAFNRLVVQSVYESGEVLIRRRRTEDGLGIALQVLEPDHLATDRDIRLQSNDNRIVQGIELDDSGRPVAYHLYKNHPGNLGTEVDNFATAFDVVRVPASEILHVYRKTRPGEVRGVPWLSPVMQKLRELDEFEDAMLVRQKVAACFSAFVYDIETPSEFDDIDDDEKKIEKLEPGIVEYLPPGKDIKFGTPPLPQAEAYKFFVATHLRGIAAGIGVTYEALAGDLSDVNFSSARMGRLDFDRNVDGWRLGMLIPMGLDPVFKWFLEAVELSGVPTEGVRNSWVPPKTEIIDPTKEVPAAIRAVRGGIASLSDVVRQSGKDPDEHFREIARDNELLDELGLVFDTDPRQVTAAGMLQIEPEEPQPEGESNDD